MNESWALVHLSSALGALLFGGGVVLLRKGTPLHRRLGYAYVTFMVALNASALSLYSRTGSFGPFHFAALISGATLVAGLVPALRRKPDRSWLALHREFMSWSFVGLLAAAAAEAAFRIPGAPYWPSIAGSSGVVFLVGGSLIYRRSRRSLARASARQRPRADRALRGDHIEP